MDLSPYKIDTFEPFWARAASVAGILVAVAAIVLLIRSAVVRRNAAPPRAYVALAAVLLVATCSSSAYHFLVRLPSAAEYERIHPGPHLVRSASNRLFEQQLLYVLVAGVLLAAAASVRPSPSVKPNRGYRNA